MSENSSHDSPEPELTPGQLATKLINEGIVGKRLTDLHKKFDEDPTITPAQFASYKSGNVLKKP